MANVDLEQLEDERVEKKLWGEKEILDINQFSQLDFLIIKKGGYCSRHKHFQKYNLFYIITVNE